ncbi:hypothetical protein MDOR_36110 [Mycolicibacterium doricum]|uniref:Uncharacterized protein n=1 Tax=Mycolicibacterium doricum TaxID=126673 RepID=A0A7I7VXS1_9MYCO|nr:hypothetical protein MDOR_36110 [Mycolicibacterium doricum]
MGRRAVEERDIDVDPTEAAGTEETAEPSADDEYFRAAVEHGHSVPVLPGVDSAPNGERCRDGSAKQAR